MFLSGEEEMMGIFATGCRHPSPDTISSAGIKCDYEKGKSLSQWYFSRKSLLCDPARLICWVYSSIEIKYLGKEKKVVSRRHIEVSM